MDANRWMSWSGLGAGVASTSDRGATWRTWAATRVNAFGTSFAVDPMNPKVWYWGHGTQLGGFSDALGGERFAAGAPQGRRVTSCPTPVNWNSLASFRLGGETGPRARIDHHLTHWTWGNPR
jgi:hypothetical protein